MVSSTPRPHFTSGKDSVPISQEVGWAPGPVWTGGKSRPHQDSIPDPPARSQSLYRLSYPAHNNNNSNNKIQQTNTFNYPGCSVPYQNEKKYRCQNIKISPDDGKY